MDKKSKKKKKNIIKELKLHEAQFKVHESQARFKILVAGRRTGKSRLMLTEIIDTCINYNGEYDLASPPVVLLGMPSLKQARSVHWSSFLNLLSDHPAVERIYKSDFRISFKGLRPDLLIRGCNDNDGDSLRGLKIFYAGIDEFQDVKFDVWQKVIYPALSDTPGSKALLIGTPNIINRNFRTMYDDALERKDWDRFHFTTYDNKYFPRERLEEAKRILPPKIFEQEFMASWVSFGGQIFPELSEEHSIDENHIPLNLLDNVYVGIDWGDVNPATVIIGVKSGIYYVLDYWLNPHENQAISADTHLKETLKLCVKWGVTQGFADPSSPGKLMDFRKGGVPKLVKGYNPVDAGNAIVSSLLFQNRLYISKNCDKVYEDMQRYHREVKDGIVTEKVAKNQEDHTCFPSGVLVLTHRGEIPIEEITLNDKVWNGEFWDDVEILSSSYSETISLRDKDNNTIRCTPNHPFVLSNGELVPADTMCYSEGVEYLNEERWKKLYTIKEEAITYIKGDIMSSIKDKENQNWRTTYIDKSGKIILEKYLKATISIIEMVVKLIISFLILNVWKCINIFHITQGENLENKKKLKNGISQKKEKVGIRPTGGSPSENTLIKKFSIIVNSVERNMRENISKGIPKDSVPINVNQDGEENQELMTKKGNALSVGQSLSPINTLKKELVLGVVPQSLEQEVVYNLKVKNVSRHYVKIGTNFVKVSNCDSLRYILATLEHKKIFKGIYYQEEEKPSNKLYSLNNLV